MIDTISLRRKIIERALYGELSTNIKFSESADELIERLNTAKSIWIKKGLTKKKAFLYGAASGIVEPAASIITIWLTGLVLPVLSYLLAFAAGAMIYVVVEELIPESQSGKHTNIGTIGVAVGFVLMMILDVALG